MSSFLSSSSKVTSFTSYPSSHPNLSQSMVEEIIQNAESVITKWDLDSSLFDHNREEAIEFVNCIKDLRQAMHFLVSQNSASKKLVLSQKLIQVAMRRLEEDFHRILSNNVNYLNPDSVSSQSSNGFENVNEDELELASEPVTKMEQVTVLAISDLKLIAECMIGSGYGRECVNIYKLIRKAFVDEEFHTLGIQQFKSSHLLHKMNRDARESVIKNWLQVVTIAMKRVINRERIMIDNVFSSSEAIRESCYSEIIQGGAIVLLKFPQLIAKSKRCPQVLFGLMNMYEAISILWPEIESISIFKSTSAIKEQALSSSLKLSVSVRAILSDFETSIQKDSSNTQVPGGGIHPLTQSTMDYILSLTFYTGILSEILADYPHTCSPFPESYFANSSYDESSPPAMSIHIAWFILVLLCKLDTKAELYKDVSMSYLFLANNLQFIVTKVHTTDLKNFLGNDWISEHAKKAKQYALNYESVTWTKVLSSFPDNIYQEMSPETAFESVKRFNAAFEEAYMKQKSWVVPDGKLRDYIKVSIATKLVPVYRELYETYSGMVSEEETSDVFVGFTPDDLGNYLSDLFHGTSIARRSSNCSFGN